MALYVDIRPRSPLSPKRTGRTPRPCRLRSPGPGTDFETPLEAQRRRFSGIVPELSGDYGSADLLFARVGKGCRLTNGGLTVRKTRHGDSFTLTMPPRRTGRASATFSAGRTCTERRT